MMTRGAFPFILCLSSLLPFTPAFAQDYGAMIQQQLQLGQQMNMQMQQMQNNVVQQNMQNPQVQQMYQSYLQQGGTMSFEQFAYNYAATGGFTPEGMQRYRQGELNNQAKEQQAWQGYRNAEQGSAQAMQGMFDRQNDIARHRGNILNGTADYVDPSTGSRYNLPNTQPQGSMYRDPYSGQVFYNGPLGQPYRGNPDGTWQQMEEDE